MDFGPPWLQSVQTAGFFKGNIQIKPFILIRNQTIMKITAIKGKELYNSEKESIKDAVIDAVKSGAYLIGANLRHADLRRANLGGAYLSGANLGGANLGGANLGGAYLSGANLNGADLRHADLRRANLRLTDLNGANLSGADLGGANLNGADLNGADLNGANLNGADLRLTDIRHADLSGANLSGANLSGANLNGAINISYIPLRCPSVGSFIAWKKVDNKLVQLEIPADARRSSATSEKCRCDKAKVLSITDMSTNEQLFEVINKNYTYTRYKVGEMVYPDAFDEDRFNECSNGIHFFTDKQLAINY